MPFVAPLVASSSFWQPANISVRTAAMDKARTRTHFLMLFIPPKFVRANPELYDKAAPAA